MSVQLEHPYYDQSSEGQCLWMRGNLHTHTSRSDGGAAPQATLDAYAERGYGFLALSDHDVWSEYADLNPRGLILLTGSEVTFAGAHLLQIGNTQRIEPHVDRQAVIDSIVAAGGFVVLNHPNWQDAFNHYPIQDLLRLQNYAGIEIFNGVCVKEAGSGYAVDKWDQLLAAGRRVWAFAHDDSHNLEGIGRGWVVVQLRAEQRNAAGVAAALKAGRFYCSTGVTIEKIETSGAEVHVLAPGAEAMEVISDSGRRALYVESPELRFDASTLNASYIRVQCYGFGARQAWTQPFFIRGGVQERRREIEQQVSRPDYQKPALKAARIKGAPLLGDLATPSAWRDAQESLLKYDLVLGTPPEVKTGLRALVTDQHLVLNVRCEEPYAERMRIKVSRDGDSAIWTDESVELFLDVEGTAERYYHMMINPAGKFYAVHHWGWARNLKHECLAVRNDNCWNVLVALALDSLGPGVKTTPGARFGLHACRNRLTVGRHYLWAWIGTSNHTPARYGTLEL